MKILNKKLNYKGFTLVELIVVISILAILGTIAFLSFGGFSSKARDGSRISDTTSLSKGLEIYNANSGKYPAPEQITGTGKIGDTEVAYLGTIQNQISTLTKISKTPKDPLSDNYYIYGTTSDYKQYQIATTLENTLSLNNWSESKVYADSQAYSARVLGNYKGLIKFSSGTTDTWIANIPSLIYDNGANLISTGTYYSVNKNTNLPYKIKDAVTNNKTADILIKEIINTSATLTGVNITEIIDKTKTIEEIFTGATLEAIGGETYLQLVTSVLNQLGVNTTSGSSNEGGDIQVNGVCGIANNKTYPNTQTIYGSDTQCSAGISTNTTFPVAGSTITWTCQGQNLGLDSSTCSASRIKTWGSDNTYRIIDTGHSTACSQDITVDGTIYTKNKCILYIPSQSIYVASSNSDTNSATHANCNNCSVGPGSTNGSAAKFCTNLKNTVSPPIGTYWYLPPLDDGGLLTIYQNILKINNVGGSSFYRSSKFGGWNYVDSRWWYRKINTDSMSSFYWSDRHRVRCIAK